jgi:hypothetical protein
MSKKKMHTYWSLEWPTFREGWLAEGTFHLPMLLAVEDKMLQKAQGHLQQGAYVVVVNQPLAYMNRLFLEDRLGLKETD